MFTLDCLEPSAIIARKCIYIPVRAGEGTRSLADLQANDMMEGLIEPQLQQYFMMRILRMRMWRPGRNLHRIWPQVEAILDDLNYSRKPYQP